MILSSQVGVRSEVRAMVMVWVRAKVCIEILEKKHGELTVR